MNQHFIEALVILMHLMEKLRIMDFALPDIVANNFIKSNEPIADLIGKEKIPLPTAENKVEH